MCGPLQLAGIGSLADLLAASPLPLPTHISPANRNYIDRLIRFLKSGFPAAAQALTFKGWLELFTFPNQAQVLSQRFLLNDELGTTIRINSFADIGRALSISRERARQLLPQGIRALQCGLSQEAAKIMCAPLVARVKKGAGLLTLDELPDARAAMWGEGISPVGAVTLLSQVFPDRLGLYRGFFCAYPESTMALVEEQVRKCLMQAGGLISLSEVEMRIRKKTTGLHIHKLNRLLRVLLRHMPDILFSRHDQIGLQRRDMGAFLHGLMLREASATPMRLRTIVDVYNTAVWPESQKGIGHIQGALGRHPGITHPAPGFYAAAGTLQSALEF